MSKKTVTFKMPVKDAPRSEDEGRQLSIGEAQTSSTAEFANSAAEDAGAAEPDQWVRRRDARAVDDAPPSVVAPSLPLAEANSVTIDLTAERDLREVAALTLIVPSVLGWFWLFNATLKYWNNFGRVIPVREGLSTPLAAERLP